jgi:SAM-dependent methyltransferase
MGGGISQPMGEHLSSPDPTLQKTPPNSGGSVGNSETFYSRHVHGEYFPVETLVPARERYDGIVRTILHRARRRPSQSLLEIGAENTSNSDFLIRELGLDRSQYVVADISQPIIDSMLVAGLRAIRLDISEDCIPFGDASFDVIILSEVLEHLVNPDHALREFRRVLRTPDSILVGTTPNLCSWFNRILLLLGKQPVFTETGTEWNFGRSPLFPKSRPVGHLRILTSQSVCELLQYHGYEGVEVKGMAFPSNIQLPRTVRGIDRVFSIAPNLAAEVLFSAKRGEL